jgi:hypothetical protein
MTDIMKTKEKARKSIDLLPDRFSSAEEAGEFWDTHSTGDYEDQLEPVDMKIEIKRRQ